MKKMRASLFWLVVAVNILPLIGCSGTQDRQPQATPPPSAAPVSLPGAGAKAGRTGSITANSNPIRVCDGTGLGITTLSWTSTGTTRVELRVGSPNGGLLSYSGPTSSAPTGKWVGNGTVFYLQDVSGGLPNTPDNTLATLTVNLTTEGCK